mmetsp:Transcript_32520/g.60119  ORF Transcript_32520/g.60119 Transcript_32520/m.60119 type:complete len:560 (-) Transcript_32520:1522-3201(-)
MDSGISKIQFNSFNNPCRYIKLSNTTRMLPLRRNMYTRLSHLRRTAALSLLATALPSSAFGGNIILSAFAASTGTPTFGSLQHQHSPLSTHPFARPLFVRGGQNPMDTNTVRNMSSDKKYPQAPPAPTISPFSRPVKKVVVVGGTHGNEYTGVWCIKAIENQRETFNNKSASGDDATSDKSNGEDNINVFERFPSLDIDTLLGNPVAFMQNKRFVDVDLNREFSKEKLLCVPIDEETTEECDIRTDFCSDGNGAAAETLSSLPHEALRAREIECLLGPKFTTTSTSSDDDASYDTPAADIVIDLHTTTANMGISLIIPEGNAFMSAAAAYVMTKCREKYGVDGAQCLMHALPKRQDRMNLSSCGFHGFTIEVGPTPQGVLRHDVVEKTEVAMHALMEFLHLRNLELENAGANNGASAILDQLREIYPGGIVPCYRSAPAVRPGELSGKISWPNDATNPNFPALMVHRSLQDRDFHPLRTGDPLFVQLDGTIIPYDGSHGEEVHLIFVNEGGYYYASSGTGIGVAVKSQFDWLTGWFVVESDDEEGVVEEVVVEVKDSYE